MSDTLSAAPWLKIHEELGVSEPPFDDRPLGAHLEETRGQWCIFRSLVPEDSASRSTIVRLTGEQSESGAAAVSLASGSTD